MANPEGLYFITFSTVEWIDVFTRQEYRDILIDSLDFCIKEKGLATTLLILEKKMP